MDSRHFQSFPVRELFLRKNIYSCLRRHGIRKYAEEYGFPYEDLNMDDDGFEKAVLPYVQEAFRGLLGHIEERSYFGRLELSLPDGHGNQEKVPHGVIISTLKCCFPNPYFDEKQDPIMTRDDRRRVEFIFLKHAAQGTIREYCKGCFVPRNVKEYDNQRAIKILQDRSHAHDFVQGMTNRKEKLRNILRVVGLIR